ncbi:MAG: pyridoxamine 5'-phosphate oxidase family protein [Acidobacteriota bacterium]|nr:pyridoxamine 5'-phosphate oxidase family protein [Acidobacteriota bacterium]
MSGDAPNTIRMLSGEECSQLLGAGHVGRLGVCGPDGPVIYPVNYLWQAGHIALRTSPGTGLAEAAQSAVAFEIDHLDEATRSGWSVLVVGTAYEVTDSMDEVSLALREAPVDTWAPGPKAVVLRVEPQSITGRAVGPAADS